MTTGGVCATAPSSPAWTHHSLRAGTPVCGGIGLDQGSPRAWLCAGREGKVRHAWFKETGSDGDRAATLNGIRKKRLLKEALTRETPTVLWVWEGRRGRNVRGHVFPIGLAGVLLLLIHSTAGSVFL